MRCSLWFSPPPALAGVGMRLFCFAHAGGGASAFRRWQALLPANIQVCAIQLPGRENRFGEAPWTELAALAEHLSVLLRPYTAFPYAFFGHSLGAKLAFAVAREVRRSKQSLPCCFFASGSRAPHLPESRPLHQLPDECFIEELRRYGVTPAAILDNRELMDLYMPLLRADFRLDETWLCREELPLECPIFVFGGEDDVEAGPEELAAWQMHTRFPCAPRLFPGGHFFLHDAEFLLLTELRAQLARCSELPLLRHTMNP